MSSEQLPAPFYVNLTDTDIASSSWIFGSRIVAVTITLPSFLLNLFLLVILRLQSSRHFNDRLILANISIAAVLSTPYQLVKSINFLVSRAKGTTFAISGFDCSLREFIYSTGIRCALLCMLGSALERYVATRFHRSYESGFRWLGILVTTVVWLQSLPGSIISVLANRDRATNVLFNVSRTATTNLNMVPMCCNMLVMDRNALLTYLALLGIGDMVGLALYLKAMHVSRQLIKSFMNWQSSLTLASRMQLLHIIDSTILLFPAILFHLIFFTFIELWIFLVHFVVPMQPLLTVSLLSLVEVFCHFYYLCYPLFILLRSESAKDITIDMLAKIRPFRHFAERCRDHRRKLKHATSVATEIWVTEGGAEQYKDFLNSFWDARAAGAGVRPMKSVKLVSNRIGFQQSEGTDLGRRSTESIVETTTRC